MGGLGLRCRFGLAVAVVIGVMGAAGCGKVDSVLERIGLKQTIALQVDPSGYKGYICIHQLTCRNDGAPWSVTLGEGTHVVTTLQAPSPSSDSNTVGTITVGSDGSVQFAGLDATFDTNVSARTLKARVHGVRVNMKEYAGLFEWLGLRMFSGAEDTTTLLLEGRRYGVRTPYAEALSRTDDNVSSATYGVTVGPNGVLTADAETLEVFTPDHTNGPWLNANTKNVLFEFARYEGYMYVGPTLIKGPQNAVVKLLPARRYGIRLPYAMSATHDDDLVTFERRSGFIVKADGTVDIDADGKSTFALSGSTATLVTHEITVDFQGYPNYFEFGKLMLGPAQASVFLVPGRRYGPQLPYSLALNRDEGTVSRSFYGVVVNHDRTLALDTDSQAYFRTEGSRLIFKTTTASLDFQGYRGLIAWGGGVVGGPLHTTKLLPGRRYALTIPYSTGAGVQLHDWASSAYYSSALLPDSTFAVDPVAAQSFAGGATLSTRVSRIQVSAGAYPGAICWVGNCSIPGQPLQLDMVLARKYTLNLSSQNTGTFTLGPDAEGVSPNPLMIDGFPLNFSVVQQAPATLPCGGVQVTVKDTDGRALLGERVLALSAAGAELTSARTGFAGTACVNVGTSGPYTFAVDRDDQQQVRFTSAPCTVPSCSAVQLTIPNAVELKVIDSDGELRPNVRVFVDDANGIPLNREYKTDSIGRVWPTLRAGEQVRFRVVENGVPYTSELCTAPACTRATVTIAKRVLVTVQDTIGRLQFGALVRVDDEQGNPVIADGQPVVVTTNMAGQAVFQLPAGKRYRFSVYDTVDDVSFPAAALCDPMGPPACSTVTIVVPPPLELTVVDVRNAPVSSEISLTARAHDGRTRPIARTPAFDGTLSVRLPSGLWSIRASRPVPDTEPVESESCWVSAGPGPAVCAPLVIRVPAAVSVNVSEGDPQASPPMREVVAIADGVARFSAFTHNGVARFFLPARKFRFRVDQSGFSHFSGSEDHCNAADGCFTAQVTLPVDCQASNAAALCDDGNACTASACVPGTGCRHTPLAEGPTPPPAACALRPVTSCVQVIRSDEFTYYNAVFVVENTSTKHNVTVEAGAENRFVPDPEDRAQPRIFRPGRQAYRVESIGETAVSWQLAGTSMTVDPLGSNRCEVVREGKTENVIIDGERYVVGLDRGAAIASAGEPTQTSDSGDGQGAVAAGLPDGALAVSHDGAAGYTLPIALPPGPNGFAPPKLALSYSSHSGNGLLGVGFTLSGVSRIERCSLHPTFGDWTFLPINWGEQFFGAPMSAFCLDGKRLIPVPNGLAADVEYRFEDDPSVRVKVSRDSEGVPTSFSMEDWAGNTLVYGGSEPDRIDAKVVTYSPHPQVPGLFVDNPSSTTERFAWTLSTVSDRFGQEALYRYSSRPNADGRQGLDHVLESIEYSGFWVRFSYHDPGRNTDVREDPAERFVAGMRLVQRRRLMRVSVELDSRLVREYRMTYELSPVTGRSRLKFVTVCDGHSTQQACKAPVKFTWQDADQTFRPSGATIPLTHDADYQTRASALSVAVADVDQDGRDDLLLRRRDVLGVYYWSFALSDGSGYPNVTPVQGLPSGVTATGFTNGTAWDPTSAGAWFSLSKPPVYSELIATDLDGDGRSEYGIRRDDGKGYSFWNLDLASGASPFNLRSVAADDFVMPYMGDINGDGLPELIARNNNVGKWRIRVNQSSDPGNFSSFYELPPGKVKGQIPSIGGASIYDWNGDGRAEFIVDHYQEPGLRALNAELNEPASATARPTPGWVNTMMVPPGEFWKEMAFDANGDGHPDSVSTLAYQQPDQNSSDDEIGVVPVFRENTGNGFRNHPGAYPDIAPPTQTSSPTPEYTRWRFGESALRVGGITDAVDNGVRVVDLDGDGRQELLVLGERYYCQPRIFEFQPICEPWTLTVPRNPFLVRLGYDGQWKVQEVSGLVHSLPVTSVSGPPGNRVVDRFWGYKLNRVLDVDGDGIAEVLLAHHDGTNPVLQVFKRESRKPDLLSAVTEGTGSRTEVSYLPMSNPEVYTPASECGYPLECPRRGRWLVREVRRSTGVASAPWRREAHHYAGAKSDMLGRGWLGFAAHSVTDPDRNNVTTFEFDNETRVPGAVAPFGLYPRAGMVKGEVTYVPGAETGISIEKETTYTNVTTTRSRVLVRPDKECERRYLHPAGSNDIGSAQRFAEVCTEYRDYDDWGFPKKTKRSGGFETLERTTTYTHRDTTPRILGIVTKIQETSTAAGRSETRVTDIEPDQHGLPKTLTIEKNGTSSTGPVTLTTTFDRNSRGLVLKETTTGDANAPVPGQTAWDPRSVSRVIHTTYDNFGYKRREVNAAGHEQLFVFDPAFGQMVAHLDAQGGLTTQKLDGFGRVVETRPPVGAWTTTSISRASDSPLIVQTTRKHGSIVLEQTTVRHDELGRPVQQSATATRNRTVHAFTRYDRYGRVHHTSAPTFDSDVSKAKFTTRERDGLDRLTRLVDADGVVSAVVTYDKSKTTVTNARNRKHAVSRDPLGVILSSENQDAAGVTTGKVTIVYGPFGVVDSTTKQLGGSASTAVTTSITYDKLGRRTSISDPDRGTTSYSPNAFGEVVWEKDASGLLEERHHDSLGRLLLTSSSDGLTSFTYDSAPGGVGNLARASSPDEVETARAYDAFGRLVAEAVVIPEVGTFEIARSYDIAGRLETIRYPEVRGERFQVRHHYSTSAGGVLWRITDPAGGTVWQAEDYSPFGGVAQEVFGNGLRVRHQVDDALGLLKTIKAGFLPGVSSAQPEDQTGPLPGVDDIATLVQDVGYDYDAARNLTDRKDRSRGMDGAPAHIIVDEVYGYDDLNRLSSWKVTAGGSATTRTYTFDDYGNLTGRTGTGAWTFAFNHPTKPHVITTATTPSGSMAFDVDEMGRRKTHGQQTVTYSAFDLPRTISVGNTTVASFAYDAFHGRVRKDSSTGQSVTVGGLYERKNPGPSGGIAHVFHIQGPGRVVAEHEWREVGPGLSSERRYLHVDRAGSVELVTGPRSGSVISRQRFEPYGNAVEPTNPNLDVSRALSPLVRRGFTGHEHDDELGFVNMQGRIYDPRSASFLTADPVVSKPEWAHAFHPFSYVVNNPVNFVDPTGLELVAIDQAEDSEPEVTYEIEVDDPDRVVSVDIYGEGVGRDSPFAKVCTAGSNGNECTTTAVKVVVRSGKSGARKGGQRRLNITAGAVIPAFMNPVEQLQWLVGAYSDGGGGVGGVVNVAGELSGANDVSKAIGRAEEARLAGDTAGAAKGYGAAAVLFGINVGMMVAGEPGGAALKPRAYSVAYEVAIPKTGKGTREAHKAAANDALLGDMKAHPELNSMIKEMGIEVRPGRKSPAGWDWHHAKAEGVLQLVPKSQHRGAGGWQGLIHPGGSGGFKAWGEKW